MLDRWIDRQADEETNRQMDGQVDIKYYQPWRGG
jgi:hypothetical protein